jgi:hypothetical protein
VQTEKLMQSEQGPPNFLFFLSSSLHFHGLIHGCHRSFPLQSSQLELNNQLKHWSEMSIIEKTNFQPSVKRIIKEIT